MFCGVPGCRVSGFGFGSRKVEVEGLGFRGSGVLPRRLRGFF